MRTQTALGLLFVALSGALIPACLNTSSTCEEHRYVCGDGGGAGSTGASGAAGSGSGAPGMSGAGGGSGDGGSLPTAGTSGVSGDSGAGGDVVVSCDTTKSPSEESCLVSNEHAIFVAPTGKDGAGGSKAGPVKTIAKAIELAGTTKMVIACDGTFDEQVKLTVGAKLYGGFACPGSAMPWKYETGKKAKVAPSSRGVALSVAAGAAAVVIEDFEFDALDATDPGESSVAAFVNSSSAVAFTRVKLVAGKGMHGANGTLTPVAFPLPPMLEGNSASGDTGGAFNLITCPAGGTTKGGKGGDGGLGISGGQNGSPDLGGGKGGTLGADCAAGGTGVSGADASPQPAASGATKVGSITPTGWTGAAGTDGAPGTPGQGGGGGTGAESNGTTGAISGGGGGGGAGGCGGAPGTAGKAGGSSIALLILNSTVALSASELVAGDAGKGGDGVAGQEGQTQSGIGGVQVKSACSGGKGGKGGKGGASGGAAGGVSLGIAYQGMAPTTDTETLFVTGAAGAKGIGGAPGTNDGIAGVKQDVLEVP